MKGFNLKLLLYADDIVILADKPLVLQSMMAGLEKYTHTWNINVNLKKSKVMIFRQCGGRLNRKEQWCYGGQKVEVVKSYKYLGMELSPALSFRSYWSESTRRTLLGLNSVWSSLILSYQVPLPATFDVFNAVTRSVLTYGCQVWGFHFNAGIEKVQRIFIKKLFKLPRNSPNYIAYIETGCIPIYVFTFITFIYIIKYVIKIMEQPDSRLIHLVAAEIIKRNILWCNDWLIWGKKIVSHFEENRIPTRYWKKNLKTLEQGIVAFYNKEFRKKST